MALIRLDGIVKTFRQGELEVRVLKDIALKVERGEFVAIMGSSGSGKSTLMYILGCLDTPTSGTYHLEGMDVSGLDDDALSAIRNSKIGFIFQSFYLIPYLDVLENVLVPTLYNPSPGDARGRALGLLDEVGLGERIGFSPGELSGGQKQRVAIVRALINDPDIILADEPTGQLDSSSSRQVMEILERLNRRGKTVIVVTHDPDTAGYARRRIMIEDGRIIQ